MPRHRESKLELLLKMPWWISGSLGVICFAAIRWGLPAWAGDVNARQMIVKGVSPLAPMPLLFFALCPLEVRPQWEQGQMPAAQVEQRRVQRVQRHRGKWRRKPFP